MKTISLRSAALSLTLFGLGALLTTACKPKPPAPDSDQAAPTARSGDVVDVAAPAIAAPDEAQLRVTAALEAIVDRHKCNRVTGCPPLVSLMQDLPEAVPATLQLLAVRGGGDGYWIEMLIEMLGQSDDPTTLRALEAYSRDKRWTVKLRAVVALGRMKNHLTDNTRDLLAEAETMAAASGDVAWLAAVVAARSEVIPAEREALRARLLTLYPTTREAVEAAPAPVLDWLVMVAVGIRLTEAAPTLRWACLSTNRFVSVSAIDGVGRFQDTGAVPYLLTRIEDVQPTVRRRAIEALQNITGMRQAETPAEWRAWAKAHDLDTIPTP